jgi:hypothetical protein
MFLLSNVEGALRSNQSFRVNGSAALFDFPFPLPLESRLFLPTAMSFVVRVEELKRVRREGDRGRERRIKSTKARETFFLTRNPKKVQQLHEKPNKEDIYIERD